MTEKKTQIKDTRSARREKIKMERKKEETKSTEMTQFLINNKKSQYTIKKPSTMALPQ